MTGEVLAAVLDGMAAARLDALILRPSLGLRYVVGHDTSGFLVLVPGLPPVFAADAAEAAALVPPGAGRVGVDTEMRVHELFALGVEADLVLASRVLDPLRIRKRPEELAAIERAATAADRVFRAAARMSWFGAAESDMAVRLASMPWTGEQVSVVVAAGENTARPEHKPGPRVINPGDAVTIQVTAQHDGYHAHASRAFVVAEPPEDFDALHAVLLLARAAAIEAVRPGVTAAEVDAAAWTVLDESGFGRYAERGTGHGVGLDRREAPWLTPDDPTVLAPGMTVTIAPAIHVPELYGARVGDVVECTANGARTLNQAPLTLHVLDP
ncbi:M24 family metallopeptidase [Sphaerisporangium fuscum]|uniref:M24 family metallopeptidase n=1 Tax=Sphaerisporangium fuscum TaxID=2835868 RepID=UPI001BDD86D4|nr:M24 family metallopeptidase [Sphaerisporangium fuscum]